MAIDFASHCKRNSSLGNSRYTQNLLNQNQQMHFGQVEVTGTFTGCRFYDPTTQFGIYSFQPDSSWETHVVKGIFFEEPVSRRSYVVTGTWKYDEKYHNDYIAMDMYDDNFGTDAEGMRMLLSSGKIRGVGPALANKIVSVFGDETYYILDKAPERLIEVSGIGYVKQQSIIDSWKECTGMRKLIVFLRKHDVGGSVAQKLYSAYENDALTVLKSNPYRVVEELNGFGFAKADQIARKLGFEETDPIRIESAVISTLRGSFGQGDTYHMYQDLITDTLYTLRKALGPDAPQVNRDTFVPLIKDAIQRLAKQDKVLVQKDRVYARVFYENEVFIANNLRGRLERNTIPPCRLIEETIALSQKEKGFEYAPEQIEAIRNALTNPVSIITGGPGTGKSTITDCILSIVKKNGQQARLCAPTGRAAKRMTEITHVTASTIHRLLESSGEGQFTRNEDYPLEGDVLIVDECSMVDTSILYHLLSAVPDTMRIIFIGDADQLPSVGPGQVLGDMIASGVIPTVKLRFIFRQDKTGTIVCNAHLINEGKMPNGIRWDGTNADVLLHNDFLFLPVKMDGQKDGVIEKNEITSVITKLTSSVIPAALGIDTDNIQILSPQWDNIGGVNDINTAMQNAEAIRRGYNRDDANHSSRNRLRLIDKVLYKGDRVMQVRNDYTKNVMNGDIGFIEDIDPIEHIVVINFNGVPVEYTYAQLVNIVLAYSITVHKSQGAEYPVVIIPLTTAHSFMLQRRLLYTGVTRTRKKVIIVGTDKAMKMAVCNAMNGKTRKTSLAERLQKLSML